MYINEKNSVFFLEKAFFLYMTHDPVSFVKIYIYTVWLLHCFDLKKKKKKLNNHLLSLLLFK